MNILCLDLEGVLVPEIWLNVAVATGDDEFGLTTKDVANYDTLMRHRLDLLRKHDLRLTDIQAIIQKCEPLAGAIEFVNWVRPRWQLAILSDTYYEFARPLMKQLGWPILLCHRLEVDSEDRIVGYHLRQKDPKRHAVKAFKKINFKVVASGDSYNDVSMLEEADLAAFFCPGEKVLADYPQYPVMENYQQLQRFLEQAETRLAEA